MLSRVKMLLHKLESIQIGLVLKTVRTYVLWSIVSGLFLPLCVLIARLQGESRYDNRWYFYLTSRWSRWLLWTGFFDVRVSGQEYLPAYPAMPAIFAINHASALDIPLVEALIGSYPHMWISKDDYGRIPLLGTLMHRMHVMVDRLSARSGAQALARARSLAHTHARHVLMFPEGSRSESGELQPFMAGFAVLARKLERPVIPVIIHNAHRIYPKNSWLVDARCATIRIEVGAPLHVQGDETDEQFTERVRAWCAQRISAVR